MDEPAFVLRAEDGQVFKVWADGRTEGFPPGVIINRIPRIVNETVHQALLAERQGARQ